MSDDILLKPEHPVGIVGYGAYVPRYRLPAKEVSRIWTDGKGGLPVKEKAVPGLDEDVVTMSIEASRNALKRANIDPQLIRAVWVGSESHPYAVKPSGTIVADAIGACPDIHCADYEFACKAGSEAMFVTLGLVKSGYVKYALAIGGDTSQGAPSEEPSVWSVSQAGVLSSPTTLWLISISMWLSPFGSRRSKPE